MRPHSYKVLKGCMFVDNTCENSWCCQAWKTSNNPPKAAVYFWVFRFYCVLNFGPISIFFVSISDRELQACSYLSLKNPKFIKCTSEILYKYAWEILTLVRINWKMTHFLYLGHVITNDEIIFESPIHLRFVIV